MIPERNCAPLMGMTRIICDEDKVFTTDLWVSQTFPTRLSLALVRHGPSLHEEHFLHITPLDAQLLGKRLLAFARQFR